MENSRPPALSLKTVLLLCLPGLLAGLILRSWLLWEIPEAYYGPDGGSYWHTAVRLWTEGNLSMVDKRRWLYPAFLCFFPLLPASPIHAVAFFQHALGLGITFLGGLIASRCTRFPRLWVPLVALFLGTWPQSLWFEHSLETETCLVAAFMWVVWLGLPPTLAGDGPFSARRLFWFLLAAALVAAWKPHGRGIWLACLLIAIWRNGSPLRWPRRCWGAISLAIVIIVSSGSSGQGNWLLLNSVLPLVPLQGKACAEERAALRPLLLEARGVRQNYAWEQEKFKYRLNSPNPAEVGEKWAELARDGKRFSRVCRVFAMEALQAEPGAFLWFTLQKIGIALSENGRSSRLEPKTFWRDQNQENASRWEKRPKELTLLYRKNAADYDQLSRQGAAKKSTLVPVVRRIAAGWGFFSAELRPGGNALHLRVAGWLALAGLLCLWLPGNLKKFSILWVPAAFYAVTVFAVGDRLGRYAYPLNWLGVIFIVVILDRAGAFLFSRAVRAREGVARKSATSFPEYPPAQ